MVENRFGLPASRSREGANQVLKQYLLRESPGRDAAKKETATFVKVAATISCGLTGY
ncbi:hypothetical protein [Neorhizobium galegae]|uniref:hypothetical protein n=1 Tax=Neorhizobium galegae TaxID=399 RepID=UPI00155ECD9F|nr:hypothetical protein [Neorhizobium galegae]